MNSKNETKSEKDIDNSNSSQKSSSKFKKNSMTKQWYPIIK
jgi:hypothetical protein